MNRCKLNIVETKELYEIVLNLGREGLDYRRIEHKINHIVCGSTIQSWINGSCKPKCLLEEHEKKDIRGSRNPHWRGGRIIQRGYIRIFYPSHPHANPIGYIAEHRLVMEQYLGRLLRKDEFVHHINGIKTDNRLENLEIVTFGEHSSITNKSIPRNSKGRYFKKSEEE